MKIDALIVDDSPAMRTFIRRVLERSGLELGSCDEANDGREALAALEAHPPSVILTDINMPGMDGEDFVRELKSREDLASLPVIVISTDGTAGRVNHMLSLGAQGYIEKPFGPEQLRDEINRVLEGFRVPYGGRE